ncbi:MAG: RluA family pseudouridine synthase [Christensenella sp.]
MTPDILYEDNHVLVAVKPQNLPSQADISQDADLLNILKQYIKEKYKKPGAVYLGLVHRLDRPAGGVMVFARTSKAAARLAAGLKDNSFEKKYYAIVTGEIPKAGTLKDYLLKDSRTNISRVVRDGTEGAKYAELSYEIKATAGGYSLLDIALKTGRSHQIRVQFANIGAPLAGDVKYIGAKNARLCLWAYELSFVHPTKKERMVFTSLPPQIFPWEMFEGEM